MIIQGKQAKEQLLSGINKTADTVKSTLGYRGKTVVINDNLRMGFHVTKDGVTVAKAIRLEDDVENLGSEFIKNAAIKTVNEAGDSTTTTTILTQKMCNMIQSELELGTNPNVIIQDLREDLSTVIEFIKNNSTKISNTEDIYKVAMVSSNTDSNVAQVIKDVYDNSNFRVAIDVVESDQLDTTYEIVKGYSMQETGYVSPIFINNQEKGRVDLKDPIIYINNGKIKSLTPALNEIFSKNIDRNIEDFRPLVIICEDIDEMPLRDIHRAFREGMIFDVCIVKSNLIFDDRKQIFVDASRVLDAEYTEDSFGTPGTCEKIIIEKDTVTFINGAGDTDKYLKELKKQSKKQENIFLNKRIFALESIAAIIKVGGKLTSEIAEKKDRIDDSVFSVKSAIEEGYSPGGSSVFITAYKELDIKTKIMKEALLECYKQLMINAELEPMYYLREIHDKGVGYGFNLITEKVSNMHEDGIYDSTKGLRVSMENAVSTACTFALINNIIT